MFSPILRPRRGRRLIQIGAPVLEIAIANRALVHHDDDKPVRNLRHLQACHEVMATGSISAGVVADAS